MAEKKTVEERVQEIRSGLESLIDEDHEKEVAQSIVRILQVLAKRTRTPLDDLLIRMVARWLGVD